MKKTIYLGMMVAAGWLVVGCSSDEPAQQLPTGEEGQPRELTINATCGNPAEGDSRTAIDYNSPTGKTGIYWMPGDQMGVVTNTDDASFTTAITMQQRQAPFTGSVTGTLIGAYYPYVKNANNNGVITLPIAQSQNWSNAQSVAANDIKAVRASDAGWQQSTTTKVEAKFQNLATLVCFRIKGMATNMTKYERLESVKMECAGKNLTGNFRFNLGGTDPMALTATGSNHADMTMTWEFLPLISAEPWGFCVIAPNDFTNQTVTFTISTIHNQTAGGTPPPHTTTITRTDLGNFEAGKCITIWLDLSGQTAQ